MSDFRLDKYDVTVGRFRQFVKVVMPGVVVAPSGYWQRSNRKGATVDFRYRNGDKVSFDWWEPLTGMQVGWICV